MRKYWPSLLLSYTTRPVLLFYTLPWLMVLLVAGTLAQRYIGLYEAEERFLSSFFIWLGPIPLPGMYIILAIIGLSLITKLILKSRWSLSHSGTIITHIGALLLLIGAMLTAISSEQGFITLGHGEQSSTISDYHQREFVILKNSIPIVRIPRTDVYKGQVITHPEMPFSLTLLETCWHCEAISRQDASPQYRGLAEKIAIIPAEPKKADEENHFGVHVEVSGAGSNQDGIYLAFEITPHRPEIVVEEDHYELIARKTTRPLPFTVTLESFTKHSYPGTNIAKEYESVVSITDGALTWQAPIRMNEPLRYKGYTLYQSSFIELRDEQYSVLAVVENSGRLFPYISSIVMCIGLLVHLVVRRRKAIFLQRPVSN